MGRHPRYRTWGELAPRVMAAAEDHNSILTFEDMDALQAGFGSEQGQAAVNDIPNFATGGVTIFFAEID